MIWVLRDSLKLCLNEIRMQDGSRTLRKGATNLENFQQSSAVPNIKYNLAVFLSNVLVICICFKIYFFIDYHSKTPPIRQNLLRFRHDALMR